MIRKFCAENENPAKMLDIFSKMHYNEVYFSAYSVVVSAVPRLYAKARRLDSEEQKTKN